MQQSSILENTDLDQLCVNTIRFLSVDAVEQTAVPRDFHWTPPRWPMSYGKGPCITILSIPLV